MADVKKKFITSDDGMAPDKDYKQDIKMLTCEWLENDIEIRKESFAQKHVIGQRVALIAGIVPLFMLGILLGLVFWPSSVFYDMGELPQTFFISASFLSFIVIYAILIKGMFHRPAEEDGGSFPTKEVVENIADKIHGNP